MTAAFADGTIWQYKCPFRKAWVDATVEEDQKLKEGYLASEKGSTEVAYLLNGVRFKTDFRTMSRMNVASKRQMEVRLRGGELPFPPLAGAGKEDEPPQKGTVLLSADALNKGLEGKPVPFGVRRAWGHGVEAGVNMVGAFSFEMKVEDKDYLGEMLSWHMLSAGIEPSSLTNQFLLFTSRHGQVARGNKDDISQMLKNTDNFPVSVVYKPPHVYKGVPDRLIGSILMQRIQLKFVQDSVNACGRNIMNVKHTHQRRTFERYLLYLEDHFYQTGDIDLRDALDHLPAHIAYLGLIAKTGPNLTRVLKGEADILEFLFGG